MTPQAPEPHEYGGNGYQEIEFGHRFDCANTPGHEICATYPDQAHVLTWGKWREDDDPSKRTTLNGHPVKVVYRVINYGPWEDHE